MIRQGKRNVDVTMLAAFCLLLLSGLVILYSTSAYNGEVKFQGRFLLSEKTIVCRRSWYCRHVRGGQGGLSFLEEACGAGISGGASSVRGSTAGGRGI